MTVVTYPVRCAIHGRGPPHATWAQPDLDRLTFVFEWPMANALRHIHEPPSQRSFGRGPIEALIVTVRGRRAILAGDLARIYGVQTKALNQAVKRNAKRFPADFMVRLTRTEAEGLRSSRSQSVTLKRGSNMKYVPLAFTEYGAIMAATVLNSARAVQMSVLVVRAFVRMRALLADTRQLAQQLSAIERELKNRLDVHEGAIVGVLQRMMDILAPETLPEPPRRVIGFRAPGARR